MLCVLVAAFPWIYLALHGDPPAPGTPNSTVVVAPLAGPFTDVANVSDVSGMLTSRGSTLASVPGGIGSPQNGSTALLTTLLPDGTYELFMLQAATPEATQRGVQRYVSPDLKTYTADAKPVVPPCPLTSASMARDSATGRYLLLLFRPLTPPQPNGLESAFAYISADGKTFQPAPSAGTPVFVDYPQAGLIYDASLNLWLDFQTTLQTLSTPKPFPDGVGASHRRVLSIRSSADGANWTKVEKVSQLLFPDPNLDPPELEFLSMIPFHYGDHQIAAAVALYSPSPFCNVRCKRTPCSFSAAGRRRYDRCHARVGHNVFCIHFLKLSS